ncbi:MAG: LuxR C-terminal-related transcriptional regulator, partial [Actinomycetia bacterium]|nr:LuxR C-terminal-related transcriptional regulator [Actinomycetes bacterium]
SGDGISPATVLELLAGLVDQSLVVPQPHPRQVRYAIPQALREYAAERLPEVTDRAVLRQRHLDCYLRIADQMSGEWFGERQAEWSQRLRDERLNLTAALEHALAEGEVESCLALLHALSITSFTSGSFAEGRRCLDMLLASETDPTAARTQALWLKALIDGYAGDISAARGASHECKVLAEQLGDDRMLSNAIEHLGVTSLLSEGPRSATDHFEESLALARRTDDSAPVAVKLVRWGQCRLLLGETAQAQRLLEEAESICRDHGENWFRGYALWSLAIVSSRAGDTGRAMEHVRSSLRLSQRVGNALGISQALEVLASILASGSSSERAAELLGAGAELRDKVGGSVVPLLAPLNEATRHKLIRVLGDRRFAAAHARGRSRSVADAVAIALAEREQAVPEQAVPETRGNGQSLTKREREVAGLIAEGLSNKEIASTLVIARRTVEGHIENVMTKFGYHSRAQIAARVAAEHGYSGTGPGEIPGS